MNTVHLKIAPVSTNKLYTGKRWKSKEARAFEWEIAKQLSFLCLDTTLPDGDLTLHLRVGTTRRQDTSNSIKLLEDCIARHYGINDRRFRALTVVRVPTKQGEEFITFQIRPFAHEDFPELIARKV